MSAGGEQAEARLVAACIADEPPFPDPEPLNPRSKAQYRLVRRTPTGKIRSYSEPFPSARKALVAVAENLYYNGAASRQDAAVWPNEMQSLGVWYIHPSGYAYKITKEDTT